MWPSFFFALEVWGKHEKNPPPKKERDQLTIAFNLKITQQREPRQPRQQELQSHPQR